MKYLCRISLFLISLNSWSQTDYSSRWEDHYSYNQVVDFVKESDVIYAITEIAAFSYNLTTDELSKTSSVDGLSGNDTSSVHYSLDQKKLIIGYDNGLIEIIDENGTIKRVVDIFLSEISTEKKINSIFEKNNKLYLSMPFGIVVYNLVDLEFEETYFIGLNSSAVEVNNVIVFNDYIYATTNDGVYIADFTSNLNDSKNWVKTFSGAFFKLTEFNGDVLVSQGKNIFSIVDAVSLDSKLTMGATIVDMNTNDLNLNVATSKQGFVYDVNYDLDISTTSISTLTVSSVYSDNEFIYLGTKDRGVLKSSLLSPDDFTEIRPNGPVLNELFSLTVNNEDLWVVYGGYSDYTPRGNKGSVDHFNGNNWVNIPYEELKEDGEASAKDLIHVTVDPENSDKVYISSWSAGNNTVDSNDKGGVLVLQDDAFLDFWNSENSGLVNFNIGSYYTTRIGTTLFDEAGNLWLINSLVGDGSGALKKLSPDGEWTGHVLSVNENHFSEMTIDLSGNIWIGSKSDGILVYNENVQGAAQYAQLKSEEKGLPSDRVKAIAIGIDGKIWIGTLRGLVVFSDIGNIFTENFQSAEPVIIEEDGVASVLLDGADINDILVDGAGNIWFATNSGGVLKTNSTGKDILESFNKNNSPLPSNNITSLGIDESTSTIYFGTTKGILSYGTGVAAYGEELVDVYAYPNPALKQHNQISIVGKSSNFPLGANIKILDVAGNLVYESNAIQSQSEFGGKFVWDKRNLSGAKVASGVYIVLIYDAENNQTATSKIAIIN